MKTVLLIALLVAAAFAFDPDARDAKRTSVTPTGGDMYGPQWANYPAPGLNNLEALRQYAASGLDQVVARPTFLDKDTNQANPQFMMTSFGDPKCTAPGHSGNLDRYCAVENPCSCGWGNTKLTSKQKQIKFDLGGEKTITLRGIGPWVDLLVTILTKIKADLPELAKQLRTAGSVCCRKIKRADGTLSPNYSNHSWGTAIDLYFGSTAHRDVQKGIAIIARYFLAYGAHWLFPDDGMHFEATISTIQGWKNSGKF